MKYLGRNPPKYFSALKDSAEHRFISEEGTTIFNFRTGAVVELVEAKPSRFI
jgi:hypothetical protein